MSGSRSTKLSRKYAERKKEGRKERWERRSGIQLSSPEVVKHMHFLVVSCKPQPEVLSEKKENKKRAGGKDGH